VKDKKEKLDGAEPNAVFAIAVMWCMHLFFLKSRAFCLLGLFLDFRLDHAGI
jgi:hypothetical protein